MTNEFIHSKTEQKGGNYSPLKEGTLALPVIVKKKESDFIRLMDRVSVHCRRFQDKFKYAKQIELP